MENVNSNDLLQAINVANYNHISFIFNKDKFGETVLFRTKDLKSYKCDIENFNKGLVEFTKTLAQPETKGWDMIEEAIVEFVEVLQKAKLNLIFNHDHKVYESDHKDFNNEIKKNNRNFANAFQQKAYKDDLVFVVTQSLPFLKDVIMKNEIEENIKVSNKIQHYSNVVKNS